MVRIAVMVAVLAATPVWAEPASDPALRALGDRTVELELDDARVIQGRLIGFDDNFVIVAATDTHEVISVPRDHVQHVILVEGPPAIAVAAAPSPRALARRGGGRV
jgi:small nuclear ribonucleoprotein (snRNP)-like protein